MPCGPSQGGVVPCGPFNTECCLRLALLSCGSSVALRFLGDVTVAKESEGLGCTICTDVPCQLLF